MEEDPGVYPLYHDDFRLLNGRLLEHYDCTDEMRKAIQKNARAVIDLQEVKSRMLLISFHMFYLIWNMKNIRLMNH